MIIRDISSDIFLNAISQVTDANYPLGPVDNLAALSRAYIEIEPDDPIIEYFQAFPQVVELENLHINSPALDKLRYSGGRLVMPLVQRGKFVSLISLGKLLSDGGDLLEDQQWLGEQEDLVIPALRLAQWIRQYKVEFLGREEIEYGSNVARILLEILLPKKIPDFPGWKVSAHWQPARAVGGDFYDFIQLNDSQFGLIIGDVTDFGMTASLVMAITKNILHSTARRYPSPGQVLSQINNILCKHIPENMFVTCLYAILDPRTGILTYANAGHDLPICKRPQGMEELRARGMPLGLLPNMKYEEGSITLEPGDGFFLYSDGLVEAHNPAQDMFGVGRLWELIEEFQFGEGSVGSLLDKLFGFTGSEWEQEDDITLLVIHRDGQSNQLRAAPERNSFRGWEWKVLGEFALPSIAGIERVASDKVLELLVETPLKKAQVDRLNTAVAEATMNAVEHGNHFDRNKPVIIKVTMSEKAISVHITDRGEDQIIPENKIPNLEAKLAGLESPRGWGMFIIRKMVDHFEMISGENHHTVILSMFLGGDLDAS